MLWKNLGDDTYITCSIYLIYKDIWEPRNENFHSKRSYMGMLSIRVFMIREHTSIYYIH